MASSFEALMLAQMNLLLNPPEAVLYQATAQSMTNGNWTTLTYDGSLSDSYNGHSNSTNPSRYTAQIAGFYMICGVVCTTANANGSRGVRLAKNGAVQTGSATFGVTNTTGDQYAISTPAWLLQMSVGDYVEVQGFQSSGAPLNTNVGSADVRSAMTVLWVHL